MFDRTFIIVCLFFIFISFFYLYFEFKYEKKYELKRCLRYFYLFMFYFSLLFFFIFSIFNYPFILKDCGMTQLVYPSNSELVEFIKNIPPKLLVNVSFILDHSTKLIGFKQNYFYEFSGIYYSKEKYIIISKVEKEKLFVLYHELGHHYWNIYLSKKERKEWLNIFETSYNQDFITNYAKTNFEEDFAESFAYYFYQRYHLDKCVKHCGLEYRRVMYLNHILKNIY